MLIKAPTVGLGVLGTGSVPRMKGEGGGVQVNSGVASPAYFQLQAQTPRPLCLQSVTMLLFSFGRPSMLTFSRALTLVLRCHES